MTRRITVEATLGLMASAYLVVRHARASRSPAIPLAPNAPVRLAVGRSGPDQLPDQSDIEADEASTDGVPRLSAFAHR